MRQLSATMNDFFTVNRKAGFREQTSSDDPGHLLRGGEVDLQHEAGGLLLGPLHALHQVQS